jgi:hypothetical protein
VYEINKTPTLRRCEILRSEADIHYNQVCNTFKECTYWTIPHRLPHLTGEAHGKRNNNHIVDPTHILALRSGVAGFLEGNTSSTRAWFIYRHQDTAMQQVSSVRQWFDIFNRRCLYNSQNSNLYHALGEFYYEYLINNTAVLFREKLNNKMFFTSLPVGSYRLLQGLDGRADTLIYIRKMSVKNVVDNYGTYDSNGMPDWSNFSSLVKEAYCASAYSEEIDVITVIERNPEYNAKQVELGKNRAYISMTYEAPSSGTSITRWRNNYNWESEVYNSNKFLKIGYFKTKPFFAAKTSSGAFPYGERGPTLDALGVIKSLNKNRINKDKALSQAVDPTFMGPANFRKSYLTTNPMGFVPLSNDDLAKGGLKPLMSQRPDIGALIQDINDERSIVSKLYYQDFLLYLTQNQKTRTAEEVRAVEAEKQLVVGPNFQSLEWTGNKPLANMIAEFTLYDDPDMPAPPNELAGQTIEPSFISLFAQSQRSADLPNIQSFLNMIIGIAPINQQILLKLDTDVLADIYSDRLFLPYGLVRSKEDVDAMKAKMQAEQQRQMQLQELQTKAGAAKDLGIQQNNPQGG